MDFENQIHVPPSFVALYSDARGRLTASKDEVRARHELCEDLAQQLDEHARSRSIHAHGSEPELLLAYHATLATPDAGLTAAEARWVVTRLAELLGWDTPGFPPEPSAA